MVASPGYRCPLRLRLPLICLAAALVSSTHANTEVLNLPATPLCSHSTFAIHRSARHVSQHWQTLRPDGQEDLFSIRSYDAASTGGHAEGYWFRLALEQQTGLIERGWTVRGSWPANHHISLELNVYTPEEMLAQTGHDSQADGELNVGDGDAEDGDESGAQLPCSMVFLHLSPRVEGVLIPASSSAAPSQASRALRFLATLASLYLDPLSGGGGDHALAGQAATPLHLTLEPLLLGVAPKAMTVRLLGVLLALLAALALLGQLIGTQEVETWLGEVIQLSGDGEEVDGK